MDEPHTSGTGLGTCVYACLQPLIITPSEQTQLKIFLEHVHLKQDVDTTDIIIITCTQDEIH